MYRISLICVSVFLNIRAAKILGVFPTPSLSHQVVFNALTHELMRRGHENVIITPNPSFSQHHAPENFTEIDVHDLSYKIYRNMTSNLNYGDIKCIATDINSLRETFLTVFENQMALGEVREIIENKNNDFDVLLVEAVTRYALAFSHVVKVPIIAVSSFCAVADNYYVMGAPIHPLLYPQMLASRFYGLSLWEKMGYWYCIFSMLNSYSKREMIENIVVKRIFGDDTPALNIIENDIDIFLINIHRLWEGCRPMPPAVIHLGGMHLKPGKGLTKELKEYLDSSTNGVIYLSFGTNVNLSVLSAYKIQAMINVFSKLQYDILWKWDQDELPGKTENIRISKWFPQSDLLKHPKIKLFITQGGQQSTDEAIDAGVPVLGIPMMMDQFYNTQKYEDYKIGKRIFLSDLTEETLMNAITAILDDKSYRENVMRLRTLMYDEPMTPLQRAAWWTERVLRLRGARYLRAPSAGMSWPEYYELELIFIVLGFTMAFILLFFFTLCNVNKICRSR
ncbi:UDP-glycosyltransferase UGT5-like [Leguminivora glycinivorella]|uniref:UDP-glycosyltransferase UGT5-like n=1 Tax=Leguminivora glycinivorella TaxID=1035111 RepID=UPI002010828B|nr:UDP-glycosyltransferase UGT5-like [Leguminivora glycinivorella]